jgi:hypothetical protein
VLICHHARCVPLVLHVTIRQVSPSIVISTATGGHNSCACVKLGGTLMAGVQEVFSWLALPLLTLTRAVLTCPAANFLSSGYVDQAWKEEHVAGLVSISGRYLLYDSLSGSALGDCKRMCWCQGNPAGGIATEYAHVRQQQLTRCTYPTLLLGTCCCRCVWWHPRSSLGYHLCPPGGL